MKTIGLCGGSGSGKGAVGKLFEMLASELVASPDAADVIVSNEEMEVREEVEVVRSCDFEKINAYLNLKK